MISPSSAPAERRESMSYASIADKLVDRIEACVSEHPEILTLDDAWGLFKVPGFKCDDIGPSLAQAQWALGKVQANHRKYPS